MIRTPRTLRASIDLKANAADPSIEDEGQPIQPFFPTDGAHAGKHERDRFGLFVLNTAGNGLPDDNMQVLILQVTTAGTLSGTLNYQVSPKELEKRSDCERGV